MISCLFVGTTHVVKFQMAWIVQVLNNVQGSNDVLNCLVEYFGNICGHVGAE